MSGGHWEYRDMRLVETFEGEVERREQLQHILETVQECLHQVDWALSGDTNKRDAADKCFKEIKKLGDYLYGEDPRGRGESEGGE